MKPKRLFTKDSEARRALEFEAIAKTIWTSAGILDNEHWVLPAAIQVLEDVTYSGGDISHLTGEQLDALVKDELKKRLLETKF